MSQYFSSNSSNIMTQKQVAISIDLGGTNLRMGVVDGRGNVIHWQEEKTPASKQKIIDSIISKASDGVKLAQREGMEVIGIGISSGGRVNFKSGIIVDSTSNLPDWKDVHIKEAIEAHLNIPAVVDNDGNCSAVAERVFGKAKSIENFISIALGTGIGGGIYVDGELLRGENNYTAEIGHVTVNAYGPKCSCGGCGCVELYASGAGLVRWAKEEFPLMTDIVTDHELSAKTIGDSARSGDRVAMKLLNRAGMMLGAAVAGWLNIFNPSMIVLSGSLVDLGDSVLWPFQRNNASTRDGADNRSIENRIFRFS